MTSKINKYRIKREQIERAGVDDIEREKVIDR